MAKYHDGAVSGSRRVVNVLLTVLLAALCVVWLYPVLLILINSLKDELAISTATVFELPTQATFAGLHNYTYGITQLNFLQSFGYSATITITSVVLILLCCSMCGWYITRVSSMISKAMLALNIYDTFYQRSGAQWKGIGQAKAVVFFLLVIVIALIQLYFTRRKEVQQ